MRRETFHWRDAMIQKHTRECAARQKIFLGDWQVHVVITVIMLINNNIPVIVSDYSVINYQLGTVQEKSVKLVFCCTGCVDEKDKDCTARDGKPLLDLANEKLIEQVGLERAKVWIHRLISLRYYLMCLKNVPVINLLLSFWESFF